MARNIQIVFDCANPDRLAAFWAGALHYKLQDPPKGYDSWKAFLEERGVPREEWNSASAIMDPEGQGPRVFFQQMDTPKPGKNRLHMDLNAGGGPAVAMDERRKAVNAEVERLLGIGAEKQREWDEDGEYWVVMLDPEGNEFCVQ